MNKHAPTPWVMRFGGMDGDSGFTLASDNDSAKNVKIVAELWPATIISEEHRQEVFATGKRILACVNGCEGINPGSVKGLLEACEAFSEEWIKITEEELSMLAGYRSFIESADNILAAIAAARTEEVTK